METNVRPDGGMRPLRGARLRERHGGSRSGQQGNRRGKEFESRTLARELEAPPVAGDEPDGGGRKETADPDGDALKLTIFEPRARIGRREDRVERSSLRA